jgi:predicted N-formylglutamate amidohydrolase
LGAKVLVSDFEKILGRDSINGEVSRLLIDLNRSPNHKNLYSDFGSKLGKKEKISIMEKYYLPHRRRVEGMVQGSIKKGKSVLHLAIHTFTPELNGEKRNCEIGLLYDSSYKLEKEFCDLWKNILQKELPSHRVRSNYPYLGKADSFPTYLRRQYQPHYLGIELEINQSLFSFSGDKYRKGEQSLGIQLAKSFQKSFSLYSKSEKSFGSVVITGEK